MKDFNQNIEHKYGIEYIDNSHVYKLDLNERTWDLQYTSPYTTIFNGVYLTDSTWANLVEAIVKMLLENDPKSREDLLNIELSWTKQAVFSEDQILQAYHGPFDNGLYINLNFDAKHMVFILLDLLTFFKIDLNQMQIYFKKKPFYEPKEVVEFYYDKAKKSLYEYLLINKRFSETKIESLFNGLQKLDLLFVKSYKSYKSLLLFENKAEYSTVKSKFYRINISRLKDEKTIKNIKKILDILTEYYGYKYSF